MRIEATEFTGSTEYRGEGSEATELTGSTEYEEGISGNGEGMQGSAAGMPYAGTVKHMLYARCLSREIEF